MCISHQAWYFLVGSQLCFPELDQWKVPVQGSRGLPAECQGSGQGCGLLLGSPVTATSLAFHCRKGGLWGTLR